MHVWLNGGLVEPADAWLPIDDHGLVVGDGGFETLKTIGGRPFAVSRHLQRLGRTLDALAISAPSPVVLRAAIDETVAAAGHAEARIRVTVTAGSGSLGTGMPGGAPSIIVAVTELGSLAVPAAITVPWTRNEGGATAGLKTTSYAENVRALRVANEAGASEALMANTRGELCEGTGTNVFVVLGGSVFTPPLSSGCLAGVTRELVLEHAEVTERSLPLDVLQTADEVFLTSTTRNVQGLERIDDRLLQVGPLTEKVAAAFQRVVTTGIDP